MLKIYIYVYILLLFQFKKINENHACHKELPKALPRRVLLSPYERYLKSACLNSVIWLEVKVEEAFAFWSSYHVENHFLSFTTNGTNKPYIRGKGPHLKPSLLKEKQQRLNFINIRKTIKIINEHERLKE